MNHRMHGLALILSLSVLWTLRAAAADAQGAAAVADAGAKVQRQFLQEQKLADSAVLIEFGRVGCEKSDDGLKRMMGLNEMKVVPGLSYLRVETSDDAKAADAYFAATKPGFPVARDPASAAAKAFAATAIPTFVLVDRFGNIRYRGRFPDDRLGDYMDLLRKETKDPGQGTPLFGAAELDVPVLLAATRLPDLTDVAKPLKDYQGDGGLMLMFVDTSCPFSAEAIGQVSAMAGKMSQQKVPTVLVNLEDPADKVKEFFGAKNPGTPVVYDVTTTTKLRWCIESVPTVVYVSAAGKVVYNGPAVWADVAAAAEKSLDLKAGTLVPRPRGTEFG